MASTPELEDRITSAVACVYLINKAIMTATTPGERTILTNLLTIAHNTVAPLRVAFDAEPRDAPFARTLLFFDRAVAEVNAFEAHLDTLGPRDRVLFIPHLAELRATFDRLTRALFTRE